MNLINHVLNIRLLIHRAFDGQFERIGIEQTGYVKKNLSSSDEELRKRIQGINDIHLKEKCGDFAAARDYTLKQCVFTLFNRLAAIKLMEQKELFPEVIKQRVENAGLSAAHQAWLENHPEGRSMQRDGLIQFMADYFMEMTSMNFLLYKKDYPYSMMPTADELNEIIHAFNAIDQDKDCADAWKNDDILGWLYENFNTAEKDEFNESGDKTEYDKVSLQSQFYTPSWVVKFLVDNSLGKLYLEMFPDSQLDKPDINGNRKYTIANRPTERTREPKDLKELRIIDPACGSGNFLLYSFSLLYDMYVEQAERYGKEYSRREIPSLIVENNLYGVDLDERAVQLAQIGLLIKAREAGGRRARMPKHTGVVCSNFYLPTYDEVKRDFGYDVGYERYDEIARKIWTDLVEAHKFGSLVRVEEQLNAIIPDEDNYSLFNADRINSLFDERNKMKTQLRNLVQCYGNKNSNPYTLLKMNESLTFLEIISQKYDAVIANPPYTYSRDFGTELKRFIDNNYISPYNVSTNLYSCFIVRGVELLENGGKLAIIHPKTFMCISKFKETRRFILENTNIDIFVDWGFLGIFPPAVRVDSAFYILTKSQVKSESIFLKLDDLYEGIRYKQFSKSYYNICNLIEDYFVYTIQQEKFLGIKSSPFIYWISDEFRAKFSDTSLSEEFDVCNGISSGGNNEQFYRYFWEINDKEIMSEDVQDKYKWVTINKGGKSNKWYGNQWLVFQWEKNGAKLKALKRKYPSIRYGYEHYYFKEGLAFNGSGKKLAVRIQPEFCLFERAGKAIYTQKECDYYGLMALLNSSLCSYIISALNSTISFQSGDLERMPYHPLNNNELSILSKQNVEIKRFLCQFSLIEPEFKQSPICANNNLDVKSCLFRHYILENTALSLVLINESIINRIVFDIYELSDNDRQLVMEKEGRAPGDLPVSAKAKAKFKEWVVGDRMPFKPTKAAMTHIDLLPECDELPNIIDFETLYQSNNEWEEFCFRHEMNPIEVWYQFINQGILPPQRSQQLAFELITDIIRTLLSKDDDGVIPLTTDAGETNLAPRIEAEMVSRGYNAAQIAQVFNLLGNGGLDRYLQERFFVQLNDHLNLFDHFPKTPFIWHITSGAHHALDLFVSIYRWSRDTLIRIKSVYAAIRETALNDRLQGLLRGDATARAQAAEVRIQLQELRDFTVKIDQLLSSGYNPILDDGVGKNIAPLQKAGLLSYNVLNTSQLKKYLNADW